MDYPHLIKILATYPRAISNQELVDYIVDHSEDADPEMVQNLLRGGSGIKKEVRVRDVIPGPEEVHLQDPWKINEYRRMPIETRPPIVLDQEYVLIDGHHRWQAAKENGEDYIDAYVVVY